jgi:hypothetical protein
MFLITVVRRKVDLTEGERIIVATQVAWEKYGGQGWRMMVNMRSSALG